MGVRGIMVDFWQRQDIHLFSETSVPPHDILFLYTIQDTVVGVLEINIRFYNWKIYYMLFIYLSIYRSHQDLRPLDMKSINNKIVNNKLKSI